MTRNREFDVYALGNALVDCQVKINEPELKQLHLRKGGMALVDVATQRRIHAFLGQRQGVWHSGGSAANTAVGLVQMGGRAAFACSVADDEFGRFFRRELAAAGLTVTGRIKQGHASGNCLVLLTPDGERTMNTCLGASARTMPDDIDDDLLARSRWLYIEGYMLTTDANRETAFAAMAAARRHGTRIAVTCSDGFVVEAFEAPLRRTVREYADIVFANQAEAAAYTGQRAPQQATRTLATEGADVFVTAGPDGVYWCVDGVADHVPTEPATPIDLTGAGDTFAAGVLYGLCRGWPPNAAARLGNAAARRVILQMGARLRGDFVAEVAAAAPDAAGAD